MADELISPDAQRKANKALTTCGRCRLKLDALSNADINVDAEYAELERTEKALRAILGIENPKPAGS